MCWIQLSARSLSGLVLILAGVIAGLAVLVMRDRRAAMDQHAWAAALLLGTGMGFVSFGEKTVPSGITALLIGMMPVWVAIFGRLFLGERLPMMAMIGIAIGFGGVAILAGPSAFGGSGALDPFGLAAIIISPMSWAAGSLFASHRATLPSRPLVATGGAGDADGSMDACQSLLERLELMAEDRPGFWERNGYHDRGDPWLEQRYWGD